MEMDRSIELEEENQKFSDRYEDNCKPQESQVKGDKNSNFLGDNLFLDNGNDVSKNSDLKRNLGTDVSSLSPSFDENASSEMCDDLECEKEGLLEESEKFIDNTKEIDILTEASIDLENYILEDNLLEAKNDNVDVLKMRDEEGYKMEVVEKEGMNENEGNLENIVGKNRGEKRKETAINFNKNKRMKENDLVMEKDAQKGTHGSADSPVYEDNKLGESNLVEIMEVESLKQKEDEDFTNKDVNREQFSVYKDNKEVAQTGKKTTEEGILVTFSCDVENKMCYEEEPLDDLVKEPANVSHGVTKESEDGIKTKLPHNTNNDNALLGENTDEELLLNDVNNEDEHIISLYENQEVNEAELLLEGEENCVEMLSLEKNKKENVAVPTKDGGEFNLLNPVKDSGKQLISSVSVGNLEKDERSIPFKDMEDGCKRSSALEKPQNSPIKEDIGYESDPKPFTVQTCSSPATRSTSQPSPTTETVGLQPRLSLDFASSLKPTLHSTPATSKPYSHSTPSTSKPYSHSTPKPYSHSTSTTSKPYSHSTPMSSKPYSHSTPTTSKPYSHSTPMSSKPYSLSQPTSYCTPAKTVLLNWKPAVFRRSKQFLSDTDSPIIEEDSNDDDDDDFDTSLMKLEQKLAEIESEQETSSNFSKNCSKMEAYHKTIVAEREEDCQKLEEVMTELSSQFLDFQKGLAQDSQDVSQISNMGSQKGVPQLATITEEGDDVAMQDGSMVDEDVDFANEQNDTVIEAKPADSVSTKEEGDTLRLTCSSMNETVVTEATLPSDDFKSQTTSNYDNSGSKVDHVKLETTSSILPGSTSKLDDVKLDLDLASGSTSYLVLDTSDSDVFYLGTEVTGKSSNSDAVKLGSTSGSTSDSDVVYLGTVVSKKSSDPDAVKLASTSGITSDSVVVKLRSTSDSDSGITSGSNSVKLGFTSGLVSGIASDSDVVKLGSTSGLESRITSDSDDVKLGFTSGLESGIASDSDVVKLGSTSGLVSGIASDSDVVKLGSKSGLVTGTTSGSDMELETPSDSDMEMETALSDVELQPETSAKIEDTVEPKEIATSDKLETATSNEVTTSSATSNEVTTSSADPVVPHSTSNYDVAFVSSSPKAVEVKEISDYDRRNLDFVSDDPLENQDNFDPKWEIWRNFTNDRDRYREIAKRWRNSSIPNSNENLTFRMCDARIRFKALQSSSSVLSGKKNKKLRRQMKKRKFQEAFNAPPDEPPAKRQRCTVATQIFDKEISAVLRKLEGQRYSIQQRLNQQLNQLAERQERETYECMYHYNGNNYHQLHARQCQEVGALTAQFRQQMLAAEQETGALVDMLRLSTDEVRTFHAFYDHLQDDDNENQFITMAQLDELLETEAMISSYQQRYGNKFN